MITSRKNSYCYIWNWFVPIYLKASLVLFAATSTITPNKDNKITFIDLMPRFLTITKDPCNFLLVWTMALMKSMFAFALVQSAWIIVSMEFTLFARPALVSISLHCAFLFCGYRHQLSENSVVNVPLHLSTQKVCMNMSYGTEWNRKWTLVTDFL